jgi:transposase
MSIAFYCVGQKEARGVGGWWITFLSIRSIFCWTSGGLLVNRSKTNRDARCSSRSSFPMPTTATSTPPLPEDVSLLQQRIAQMQREVQIKDQMVEHLLTDVAAKDREILKLQCQLETLRRQIFGRKSEKIDPNQLALFESLSRQLEAAQAQPSVPEPALPEKTSASTTPAQRNGHGRRVLPEDLPRERIEVPVEEAGRTCCGQPMRQIGEEITQKLGYVPGSFVIREYVRPKYACGQCAEGVVIPPLPPSPIPKGIAEPDLLAQILTSKYADHCPLNRQQSIYRRHGVEIAVSTLCDWVRDMADLLSPIVLAIHGQILQAHHINTDDTGVLVQDRVGRPCGKGYLWVYIGDGAQAVFVFTETHSRDGPLDFLKDYRGYVQADAHSSYNGLFAPDSAGQASPRTEVGCWAHARRKFYDARLDDRPRCTTLLGLVQELYQVEAQAKDLTPKARLALRQELSAPVVAQIQERLDLWSVELLPKNPVAQAVHYARAQWTALLRPWEDGRLSLDNNISERLLRMAAVGRKNWTFFGSDAGGHRAAVIYSLVASCKLCGIDPFAYLRDVITRACVPTFTDFAALTPLAWKAAQTLTANA